MKNILQFRQKVSRSLGRIGAALIALSLAVSVQA